MVAAVVQDSEKFAQVVIPGQWFKFMSETQLLQQQSMWLFMFLEDLAVYASEQCLIVRFWEHSMHFW